MGRSTSVRRPRYFPRTPSESLSWRTDDAMGRMRTTDHSSSDELSRQRKDAVRILVSNSLGKSSAKRIRSGLAACRPSGQQTREGAFGVCANDAISGRDTITSIDVWTTIGVIRAPGASNTLIFRLQASVRDTIKGCVEIRGQMTRLSGHRQPSTFGLCGDTDAFGCWQTAVRVSLSNFVDLTSTEDGTLQNQ